MKIKLNTISEAINDFKKGKVLIVVDDENRENMSDFVFSTNNNQRNCQFYD